MLRTLKSNGLKNASADFSGDTIVEVLLAIAIAAFAIGITYATAQRALNQSIAAREHTEALNIIQNQVTDLRLRFQKSSSPNVFNASFGGGGHHFCLDDTAASPSDTHWMPYVNSGSPTEASPLQPGIYNNSNPGNSCVRNKPGEGATYFIDIQTTTLSGITQNPTIYQVFVRWDRVGGGRNQASVYFRVNGANGQLLGWNGGNLDSIYAYKENSHEA